MTQLTKKKLKEIMLEVLSNQDQQNQDEWYTSNYEYAKFGIELLAEKLNIKLDLENDDD